MSEVNLIRNTGIGGGNYKYCPTKEEYDNWFLSKSAKLTNCARPVSLFKMKPIGFCINELAIKIQSADKLEPIVTSQIKVACKAGLTLSQLNIQKPINVDSRKKATNASIASGAPKISPTNRE